MELTASAGRNVLLRDDGSWRYQDGSEKGKPVPKDAAGPMADLALERKIERITNCRLVRSLSNNLPYEIRQIVSYFSVYRANGVLHETQSAALHSIRPTDRTETTIDFSRVTCDDFARVQATGGNRCEMGELLKFSEASGQCVTRIRSVPTALARSNK